MSAGSAPLGRAEFRSIDFPRDADRSQARRRVRTTPGCTCGHGSATARPRPQPLGRAGPSRVQTRAFFVFNGEWFYAPCQGTTERYTSTRIASRPLRSYIAIQRYTPLYTAIHYTAIHRHTLYNLCLRGSRAATQHPSVCPRGQPVGIYVRTRRRGANEAPTAYEPTHTQTHTQEIYVRTRRRGANEAGPRPATTCEPTHLPTHTQTHTHTHKRKHRHTHMAV